MLIPQRNAGWASYLEPCRPQCCRLGVLAAATLLVFDLGTIPLVVSGAGREDRAWLCSSHETICKLRQSPAIGKLHDRRPEDGKEVAVQWEDAPRHAKRVVDSVLAQDGSLASHYAEHGESSNLRKLLVLVVGQRQRFYPLWTLQRVVAPAARAGFEVDYSAMLSWELNPTLGGNAFNAFWYRPVANPAFENVTAEVLENYLLRLAQFYGARRVFLTILRHDSGISEVPATSPSWQRRWLGSASRESTTFVRDLHRLKQIEMLWNATRQHQLTDGIDHYHHVILVRDDSFWADDVHMVHFPDPRTIYSRQFGFLCQSSSDEGPDDKALVLGGRIAGSFLKLYTEYFHNRDPSLDNMDSLEHFLLLVARARRIRWSYVRKDWLPYFTAQHMLQPEWAEPRLCLRGITRKILYHPTDVCVHPSTLPVPFCEDFPLL